MSDALAFNRPKPNWQDIKIFTADGTDLAVRVQCSDGHRPLYSYAIGRMRDGRFITFIRPQTTVENCTVNLTPFPLETLGRLIAQAEQLIHGRLQEREDEFLLKRQAKERRDANFGRQEFNHTGKTARKKGKTYADETEDRGWK